MRKDVAGINADIAQINKDYDEEGKMIKELKEKILLLDNENEDMREEKAQLKYQHSDNLVRVKYH